MGNHPSVVVEFEIPDVKPEVVVLKLTQAAQENKHFSDVNSPNDNTVRALFHTPGCGWIDACEMQVQASGSGTKITGTAASTNVCCGYWGPLRQSVAWYGLFDDHGQNSLHLREWINSAKLEHNEKLIKKIGLARYAAPK